MPDTAHSGETSRSQAHSRMGTRFSEPLRRRERGEEQGESFLVFPLRPLRLSGEISFEVFEPKNESEVPEGTVTRAKATCLCCGAVLPPERVRAQLAEQRGGADVIFEEVHRRGAESAEDNMDSVSAPSASRR